MGKHDQPRVAEDMPQDIIDAAEQLAIDRQRYAGILREADRKILAAQRTTARLRRATALYGERLKHDGSVTG